MKQSVNFLMSGDAHAPYLVVALSTLREHYAGDVVVWAYPESMVTVQRIAHDPALRVVCRLWEPVYRGKNGQFFNKIALMRSLHDSPHVYLDADVMINRPIDYLFTAAKRSGFVATQFNNWLSNGGVVKKRINHLLTIPEICSQNVQFVMDNPLPSVNGGVFACRPDSPVLQLWQEWTKAALGIFIADETVLHAILGRYHATSWMTVLTGGIWNCSPRYRPNDISDEDVAIWHFHGDSNVRPSKSQKGYDIWWPRFQKCLDENTGGIQEWLAGAVDQNRFLKELMK